MNINNKHSKRETGSFTLEAALIMPIVILVIIAAVFAGMVLCQQVLVQGCANRAAARGAEIWANAGANITTGAFSQYDATESSLYWRIYDKDSDVKLEKIREYAQELLVSKTVFVPVDTSVNVSIGRKPLYKELVVKIICKYKLPVAGVGLLFGGDGNITVEAESVVQINDPPEFIRNTDFILDIGREIKEAFPQIDELKTNITGAVTDILKNLFPK